MSMQPPATVKWVSAKPTPAPAPKATKHHGRVYRVVTFIPRQIKTIFNKIFGNKKAEFQRKSLDLGHGNRKISLNVPTAPDTEKTPPPAKPDGAVVQTLGGAVNLGNARGLPNLFNRFVEDATANGVDVGQPQVFKGVKPAEVDRPDSEWDPAECDQHGQDAIPHYIQSQS